MKISTILSMLAATVFLLTAVTSSAQELSKKEILAGELLDYLHLEKTLDTVFETMPKMQRQVLEAQKLPPEQKEKVREHVQATMDGIRQSLIWESIRPMYVKVYADNFDEAELAGIIAYYKSPVGQKWLEKQPVVQAAKMQVVTDIMLKVQAAAHGAAKNVDGRTEAKPMATP